MSRDFGKEIDEIKNNIKEMYEMMKNNIDMKSINRHVSNAVNDFMRNFNQDKTESSEPNTDDTTSDKKVDLMEIENQVMLKQILENLIKSRNENNVSGYISYCGNFEASDRESRWSTKSINTDDLLTLIEDKSAVKVLNCIGNSLRLDILLAILKKPMTVTQLVEHFGSNSTGQIYHHLGPLITADLIVEDTNNKGMYIVQPHRVQGIIMMLAGIQDMIDTKYTEGNWTQDL